MSVTWTLTAGEAIQRAYLMLGNLNPPDYTPTAFQMTQGLTVLNGLLKGLEADGINLFRQEQITLTVPALSQTVQIAPYIMGFEEARWVVSPAPNLYERPLGIYTYDQYMQLPNKLSAVGSPSVVMFDRQVSTSQFWIWPLAQNGGTINATVGRLANDVAEAADPIDLPSEWLLGLTYGLANVLMEDQGTAGMDPVTAQRIATLAAQWHDKLDAFDRPTSVFMKPYGRKGAGKFWR